jgi:tRNA-specific 2-thiouridylase
MSEKKIIIGLSGGVDSSVAALLLKEQGYNVVGLFMRNWHEKDDFGHCTSEQDYDDARRVADALDIPYYSIDFSKQYMEEVFSLFVSEYEKGRTPNPDVLCNKEIKFGHFKHYAKTLGFNLISTGHYAGILEKNGRTYLTRAKDEGKDQTYFLNQLTEEQIKNVVFPLADLTKDEVRKIAKKYNLPTATKKDSTGICFIGERDFRKFLSEYIPMKKGMILSLEGKELGTHNGVFYYTIGQRKGLGIGGAGTGEPYFVVKKDVKNNILYVNQGECEELFYKSLTTSDFNFITEPVEEGKRVYARTRHRQPLISSTVTYTEGGKLKLLFDTPIRAVTPGQYAVIYDDKICLGGGIIE